MDENLTTSIEYGVWREVWHSSWMAMIAATDEKTKKMVDDRSISLGRVPNYGSIRDVLLEEIKT